MRIRLRRPRLRPNLRQRLYQDLLSAKKRAWLERDLADLLVFESNRLSILRVRRSDIERLHGGRYWRSASGGWGTIIAAAVPIGIWLFAAFLAIFVGFIWLALLQPLIFMPEIGAGLWLGLRLMPKPLYVARREAGRPNPATWAGREATVNPAYLGHLIEAESLRRRFAKRESGRSKLVIGALIAGIVGMAGILYLVYVSGG